MLRGYLDGLSRTPMPVSAPTSASSASPSPTREPVTVTLTVVDAGAPASRDARACAHVRKCRAEPAAARSGAACASGKATVVCGGYREVAST